MLPLHILKPHLDFWSKRLSTLYPFFEQDELIDATILIKGTRELEDETHISFRVRCDMLDYIRSQARKFWLMKDAEVVNDRAVSSHGVDTTDFQSGFDNRDLLNYLMEKAALKKIQRTIIYEYYYQGATMQEIGEVMNLSRGRISVLHKEALEALKEVYNNMR